MKVAPQLDQKLANLVICGVNKAGSTSLFKYLSDHPEISPSKEKETLFFRSLMYREPLPSTSEYAEFFDQRASEKYLMEADPRYFYGKKPLAAGMKEELPDDLKVILILRDPVKRFISFYKFKYFNFRPGVDQLSFDDFLERCFREYKDRKDEPFVRNDYLYVRALKEGLYIDFIHDWVEVYEDNFLICFFDELKDHPQQLMRKISRWLEIPDSFYGSYEFSNENKSVPPRHKTIHQLANRLNEQFDYFWLKNPGLKKKIRNFYYQVNKSNKRKISVSDASLRRLEEFYREPNQHLRQYLQEKGVQNLPAWLNNPQQNRR
jgi:hypothetical protein